MKKFSLLFFTFFSINFAFSEHITGGDFSVQHVEGNTFEGILTLYRDCNTFGAPFDQIVEITVRDLVTDENITDLYFEFVGFESFEAELGNSCYTPDICLEIGTYITTFTLDDNPNGYYLTKERCCRNDLSDNLQGTDLGFVFTLDVPDPALENSSPVFGPYPTEAYFCVNGVNEIDFGATDADGDSLVYSFTEPLNGVSTAFEPNPAIASAKPFPIVDWAPGYATDDQIGGDIPMTIDSETGLIVAQPNLLGVFSIAVKVEEYRDGEKIGEIRRELQLTSSVCDIDLPSVISTPDNDTIFDILANTEFCIDILATDPNEGDTLFMEADGTILDGSVTPQASLPDVDGFSNVQEQFCWTPLCNNVSDEPYVITVTAFSRGCANEVLVTTQDLYFNVYLEEDEQTEITGPVPEATIDLYDPGTHCFDFVFTDPNEADSLLVFASSPILDLDRTSIEDFSIDQGQIAVPFCWNVICEDVQDEPYFIDFEVVAINCEVQDTTNFTVPINVIVPDNLPTTFIEPSNEIFFEFYSQDTLNIPITVADENFFDTLSVSADSEIFNLLGNPANISDSLDGNSLVQGLIQWVPSCEDVRPEPYEITFTATANSCKTDDLVTYEVDVYLTLPPENAASFQIPNDGEYIEHFIGDEIIDVAVLAQDPDPYDTLSLEYEFGSPALPQSTPVFETLGITTGISGNFLWQPDCSDVSEEPYPVTFTVTSRSCQKVVEEEIQIEIFVTTPTRGVIEPIQNVMTPNGDGRNDVWTIENKEDPCLLGFRAQIFDRWGKEVYITEDPAFEWTGEYGNGNEALQGTYFRIIEYVYKDQAKSFQGDLEILK
ncbi:MAG: gliding motility-associated C-terminal domain-containing protein [Cryomorphaceae bacterium]